MEVNVQQMIHFDHECLMYFLVKKTLWCLLIFEVTKIWLHVVFIAYYYSAHCAMNCMCILHPRVLLLLPLYCQLGLLL